MLFLCESALKTPSHRTEKYLNTYLLLYYSNKLIIFGGDIMNGYLSEGTQLELFDAQGMPNQKSTTQPLMGERNRIGYPLEDLGLSPGVVPIPFDGQNLMGCSRRTQ
jgi:hypothetical protein